MQCVVHDPARVPDPKNCAFFPKRKQGQVAPIQQLCGSSKQAQMPEDHCVGSRLSLWRVAWLSSTGGTRSSSVSRPYKGTY
uniref:Uncharacterized protein n=1 Tax=Arundo donax TaxID=35708 RepID=A0A0A9FQ69_ARUDO